MQNECKYCYDEFCTNDKCPLVADYCPVPNDPDVCKWEERVLTMQNDMRDRLVELIDDADYDDNLTLTKQSNTT